MRNSKRRIAFLLAAALLLSVLVGCGTSEITETESEQGTATEREQDTTKESEEKETMETEKTTNADEVGNGKHVMTFVMGSSQIPSISGKWSTWNNNAHQPDKAGTDGLRDIASIYYPSIGLYDVTDPDYQEYMMQLCKMCYVDTINYYVRNPEDIESNKTVWGKNFDTLVVDMLRKYGLSSSARLANFPSDYNNEAGKTLTALIEKLGDTILTINGKPVLAQFTMKDMTPAQVDAWKDDYAATHNGVYPFLMTWQHASYQQASWMEVSDGQFGWVELDNSKVQTFWKNGVYLSYADLETAKKNHDATVNKANNYIAQGLMPFYAEAVTPGFDSLGCWGWGVGPSKVESGEDGELYEYKWQAAVENGFPIVVIPTWDDWGEASTIEPTLEYGIRYLEITRKYAAEYKGLEANTANLELPGWIYKIRKTTKDKTILAAMDVACQLIAEARYSEAEALVAPYVTTVGVPAVSTEYFNYPVIAIKPTTPTDTENVPVVEGNTVTWKAIADTYVQQNSIDDFGSADILRVKNDSAKGLSRNAFVKFDLTDAASGTIERVVLRMYCQFASTTAAEIANRKYGLYAVSADWSEKGMRWDTQPSAVKKVSDMDTKNAKKGQWIEVDVTEYVLSHMGESIAFMIRNDGVASNENHINFSARETKGQEPQLVIQYAQPVTQ